jgi:hypothetical protein
MYTYDALGNLHSITRSTGGVVVPTIMRLHRTMVGVAVNVSLTGTNLTVLRSPRVNPGILAWKVLATPNVRSPRHIVD